MFRSLETKAKGSKTEILLISRLVVLVDQAENGKTT